MKIIKVYQPVLEKEEGVWYLHQLFATSEEAAKASSSYGEVKPRPREGVLLDDGTVWLLEGEPAPLFHSKEQLEREEALKKLTDRERQLLGLPTRATLVALKSDSVLRDL